MHHQFLFIQKVVYKGEPLIYRVERYEELARYEFNEFLIEMQHFLQIEELCS